MISTEVNSYLEYSGNNSTTTAYQVTFTYQNAGDIKVYVDGVLYTTWAITNTTELRTTTAIATTSTVRIERDQDITQTQDLVPNGDFPAAATETTYDKFILLLKQVSDTFKRCFVISRASPETEQAEFTATADRYIYVNSSGQVETRTKAQIASDVSGELSLPTNLDRPTQIAADDSARTALAPAFTGQFLSQSDDQSIYAATGTSAGNWTQVGGPTRTFTTKALLLAATPDYVHQNAAVVPTNGTGVVSWWRAYGTTAADWSFIGYGDFTPPAQADPWNNGVAYTVGQILKTPNQTVATGTAQGGTATTIQLASGHTFSDDELNGCRVVITGGTGSGQARHVLDYVGSTDTCTVDDWVTNPDATSTYDVVWEGGSAVWECISAHTSSTNFVTDLNVDSRWQLYVIEDYHYTVHDPRSSFDYTYIVQLGDASRADEWSRIVDHIYNNVLPSTGGGAGIDGKWGSSPSYVVTGTIRFTEGSYFIDDTLKHVPLCTLQGPDTPTYWNEPTEIVCRASSLVSNGGSEYWCKQNHYAGDDDEEPGVGANEATYWGTISAWAAGGATYIFGEVRTIGGSYYRCTNPHTSSGTGATDEPGTGNTWYQFWSNLGTSPTIAAWADNTYYLEGFNGRWDWICEGAYRGSSSSANSNFFSGIERLYFSGNGMAQYGVYAFISHSRLDLEVDRTTWAGLRIATDSDNNEIRYRQTRLNSNSGEAVKYGIWCDQSIVNNTFIQTILTKCEVGVSLGISRSSTFIGTECENTGKLFDYREDGHANFDGTAGSEAGAPLGDHWMGIRAGRDSTDPTTVSTQYLGFARFNQDRRCGLILEGLSHDLSASSAPFDRVQIQAQTGTKRDLPLVPNRIDNPGGWDDFHFHFDLYEMVQNKRFHSNHTKEQDSRLVTTNNPAQQTDNGTTAIAMPAGLYKIEIPAANGYDSGDVTVKDSPSGNVIPGMNAYSTTSLLERWWWHHGGSMEIVIANVAASSATIDVYFHPWPNNFAEGNHASGLP